MHSDLFHLVNMFMLTYDVTNELFHLSHIPRERTEEKHISYFPSDNGINWHHQKWIFLWRWWKVAKGEIRESYYGRNKHEEKSLWLFFWFLGPIDHPHEYSTNLVFSSLGLNSSMFVNCSVFCDVWYVQISILGQNVMFGNFDVRFNLVFVPRLL